MIDQIEDAILARIQAAADAGVLGWKPKTLETYNGQLDGEKLRLATQSYPAVFVVFAGEPKPEEVGGGAFRHKPIFSVLMGQKNLRNEAAQRRGAGDKVGIYQMILDMRGLLSGQVLTLGVDPDTDQPIVLPMERIHPGAVRFVKQGEGVSIYALELHTSYDEAPTWADPSALDDFATFNVDWDIPTFGTIDATDTLTLETQP